MSFACIEIRDIEKTYKPEKLLPLRKELPPGARRGRKVPKALREITLDILQGQNVGIVGESGCGKTTLTKIIANMLQPDKGKGRLSLVRDGERLSWREIGFQEIRRYRNRIQYVFQHPGDVLSPTKKAGAIVTEGYFAYLALRMGTMYALRRKCRHLLDMLLTGREVPPEIEELMREDLQLGPEQIGSYTNELSGGEQKRVLLAKAFASMGKLSNVTIRRAAAQALENPGDPAAGRLLAVVDEDFRRIALRQEMIELAKSLRQMLRSEHGIFKLLPPEALAAMDREGEHLFDSTRLEKEAAELRARKDDIVALFTETAKEGDRRREEGVRSSTFTPDEICAELARWIATPQDQWAEPPPFSGRQVAEALESELTDFLADLAARNVPIRSRYGIFQLNQDMLKALLDSAEWEQMDAPDELLEARSENNILRTLFEVKLCELDEAIQRLAGRCRPRQFPYPKFLILDEPMRGIDSVNKLKIVRDLQETRGAITLITITHDIHILSPLADRIVVMYGGLIQEICDRKDLPLDPRSPESAFEELHPYTEALIRGECEGGVKLDLPVPEETGPGIQGQGCIFRTICTKFKKEKIPQDIRKLCLSQPPPLVQIERPDRQSRCIRCWAYHSPAPEAATPSSLRDEG